MIPRTLIRLTLSLVVLIATLAAIGLALAQAPSAPAGSHAYPGLAPCDTTLQACLDGLNDGDVVHILPGVYTVSLTLNKAISLIGTEPTSSTVLVAPGSQRVLTISGPALNNSVAIAGLQIIGGDLSAGNKCPANCGGGILIYDGAWPTLANLVISGGRAYQGGGLYIDQTGQAQGSIVITHSQIISNSAVDSGGGIYMSMGKVILAGEANVDDNSAANSGGGVYINKGDFTLQNGHVRGNRAVAGDGGGLYIENPSATYTQIAGTLAHNTAAGSGGGVYVVNNNVNLAGGLIFSNTAIAGSGGGIYVDKGSLNWAGPVEVIGNRALNGGGLYVNTGSVQLTGGQLVNNAASGNGGGLYANQAITINATQFLANSAEGVGGGAYLAGTGAVNVANALLAQNNAGQAAAGLALNSAGTVTLRHLTIADPMSNSREALVVTAGTVDIRNTIIVSHAIGISQTAGMLTADYNLYFGNGVNQSGTTLPGSHDVVGLDPLFVDPAAGIDNYHLQLFSPAVDVGIDAGVYTDLGGQPRPIAHGFDIGAFELQADTTNIGPEVGGTLNYTSSTGTMAEVIMPAGLVLTPTIVVFNNLVDTSTVTITPPLSLSLSGNVFDIDAFVNNSQLTGVTFTLPVTIVIHYSEADVKGLLRNTLKLYRYEHPPYGDGWCAIGECRPAETQWLDMNTNTLTARVLGFSRWGKMGAGAAYSVFLPVTIRN